MTPPKLVSRIAWVCVVLCAFGVAFGALQRYGQKHHWAWVQSVVERASGVPLLGPLLEWSSVWAFLGTVFLSGAAIHHLQQFSQRPPRESVRFAAAVSAVSLSPLLALIAGRRLDPGIIVIFLPVLWNVTLVGVALARTGGWVQPSQSVLEIFIAGLVVCLLSGLLVPAMLGGAERARQSRARSDVANIGRAIARVRTDTGSTSAACLTNLQNLPLGSAPGACGSGPWSGPYLPIVTNDPWDSPYSAALDGNTILVRSAGADGEPDTTDDITFAQ